MLLMRLRFTKMQGAGNDFVVLDGTRECLSLSRPQVLRLADRRFGVGADQILLVERSPDPEADFGYRIYNASGDEVEHCGNGARCFLRFVRARGLATQTVVRVRTVNRLLELREGDDGQVIVDMGAPEFDPARVPFNVAGLRAIPASLGAAQPASVDAAPELTSFSPWPLRLAGGVEMAVAVLSMGNPHAVVRVEDVEATPVVTLGPEIEQHERFPHRVNAGFLQVLGRREVRLRVWERGAGETLACGTGACAAVVAGIRLGWLDAQVQVHTRGGRLGVSWDGAQRLSAPVYLSGPAEFVFEGEIDL